MRLLIAMIIVIIIILLITYKQKESMTKIYRGVGFLNTGDETPVASGIVNSGPVGDMTYSYFDGSSLESCDMCPNGIVCPSCPQFYSDDHGNSYPEAVPSAMPPMSMSERMANSTDITSQNLASNVGNVGASDLVKSVGCMIGKFRDALPAPSLFSIGKDAGDVPISTAHLNACNPDDVEEMYGGLRDYDEYTDDSGGHIHIVSSNPAMGEYMANGSSHELRTLIADRQRLVNPNSAPKWHEDFTAIGVPGIFGQRPPNPKLSHEQQAIANASFSHPFDQEFFTPIGVAGLLPKPIAGPEADALMFARGKIINPHNVAGERFIPTGVSGILGQRPPNPKLSHEQQAIANASFSHPFDQEFFTPIGTPGILGQRPPNPKLSHEQQAIANAAFAQHPMDQEYMSAGGSKASHARVAAGHRQYFPPQGLFHERIPNSELDARIYAPGRTCGQSYNSRVNELLYHDIMQLDSSAGPSEDFCEYLSLNGYVYSEPCDMKGILDYNCRVMAARSSSNRK